MQLGLKNAQLKQINSWLSKPMIPHVAFWLVFLLILLALDNGQGGFWFNLTAETVNILFYAAIVYFNLLYLIPHYLSDKRFMQYCLFLLLTVIVITPIKIFIFYFLLSYFPQAQEQLIVDQNWYFLSNFVIAGISTVIKIISDWLRYQRDRQELQTRTMQSELRFLKSQINPHFLFNTLNSLYALTLKKSDKAPEIVIKLSEMMRYMLYECNERRVLLQKEINYLKNYLDLERLRQSHHARIQFDVQGMVSDQRIAPLMFIPFLENSFKHGLNSQISEGFVDISLDVQASEVTLKIENSKADKIPQLTHKRSGGIGLINVRRRLDLLYPDRYALNIEDNPNTYLVELKLELD